jgi:hypothetical protein
MRLLQPGSTKHVRQIINISIPASEPSSHSEVQNKVKVYSTHVHRSPERLEPAQDDQDQAPSVPQRKGGVNEQFVGDRLLATGFRGFDGVVDLGDGSADEEGEDEGGDVPCQVSR